MMEVALHALGVALLYVIGGVLAFAAGFVVGKHRQWYMDHQEFKRHEEEGL